VGSTESQREGHFTRWLFIFFEQQAARTHKTSPWLTGNYKQSKCHSKAYAGRNEYRWISAYGSVPRTNCMILAFCLKQTLTMNNLSCMGHIGLIWLSSRHVRDN